MDLLFHSKSRLFLTPVVFAALMVALFSVTTVAPVRAVTAWLRWALPFALGVWALIVAALSRSLPRRFHRSDTLACSFIGFALLSSLYSIDPRTTLLRSFSVMLIYGAVFWGLWLYVDLGSSAKMVRTMLSAAALALSLHLLILVLSPSWALYHDSVRFVGWAENPGAVGSLASLSMPLALWNALSNRRWYSWTLVGAMLLVIVMAHTRTEAIAMVVGSGYFLLRALPSKRLLVVGMGAAYLLAFISWSLVSPGLYERYGPDLPKGVLDNVEQQAQLDTAQAQLDTAQAQLDTAQAQLDTAQAQLDTEQLDIEQLDIERVQLDSARAELDTARVQLDSARAELDSARAELDTAQLDTAQALLETINGQQHVEASDTATGTTVEQEQWYLVGNPRYGLAHLGTLAMRSQKWARGITYLLERPLFGFGFGTESQLFSFHGLNKVEWIYTGGYMHNSYLGLALQVGIPGALLFFLPLALLIIREVRQEVLLSHTGVRVAVLGFVLAGMTSAIASSWIYSMGNPNGLQFWVCVMLLVRFRVQVDAEVDGVRNVAN